MLHFCIGYQNAYDTGTHMVYNVAVFITFVVVAVVVAVAVVAVAVTVALLK